MSVSDFEAYLASCGVTGIPRGVLKSTLAAAKARLRYGMGGEPAEPPVAASLLCLAAPVAAPAGAAGGLGVDWLDKAVKRAWGGKRKGGPGSGVRGHTTPRESSGGVATAAATPAHYEKFLGVLAAHKDKWSDEAFKRELETPMDFPPPGYATDGEGNDVHVPTLVTETQQLTATKLALHKVANDPFGQHADRDKAADELKRLGGLTDDEQKIADLCKSLLGVDIGAVAKAWTEAPKELTEPKVESPAPVE